MTIGYGSAPLHAGAGFSAGAGDRRDRGQHRTALYNAGADHFRRDCNRLPVGFRGLRPRRMGASTEHKLATTKVASHCLATRPTQRGFFIGKGLGGGAHSRVHVGYHFADQIGANAPSGDLVTATITI